MAIITGSDLASYPGIDSTLTPEQLDWIAEQISGLVEAAWQCPTFPVPAWVKTIALNAAGRFAQNPRGLESWTRSVDDASRTERTARATGGGLGLTETEIADLACTDLAAGVGTIRTWPNGFNR